MIDELKELSNDPDLQEVFGKNLTRSTIIEGRNRIVQARNEIVAELPDVMTKEMKLE